ncbi:hypothetical protein CP10743SC13_1501A, partial [Chlamydia psittaci 10_743_SC13]
MPLCNIERKRGDGTEPTKLHTT